MRRFLIFSCVLALTGCAWLGFGDDAETTATEEPQIQADAPAEPVQAPVKAEKPASKAAKTAKGAKNEAQIKASLDETGKKLAAQSARTLLPNKAHPEYKKVGSEWVASYIDVDPNRVSTELRPGASGQYVGFIRYQERFMECRGATKQEAMKGNCRQVRSRNLTEMIRYDGKAWQD